MKRNLYVVSLSTALSGLLTGCSSSQDQSTTPATVEFDGGMVAPSRYPVDDELLYGRSWVDDLASQAKVYNRFQAMIVDCMAAKGFEHVPGEPGLGDELATKNPLNEAVARAVGYHLDVLYEEDNAASDANQQQGDEFWAALQDFEVEHGCAPESWDKTIGRLQPYLDVLEPLLGLAVDEIGAYDSSPGAVELQAQWSACMGRRGYNYPNRLAVLDEFLDSPDVSDDEIRVRLVDIECDREVGLTKTKSESQQALLSEWEDEHAAELAEVRQAREAYGAVFDE